MKKWKSLLSVLTIAAMLFGACGASAEEVLSAILTAGTTQAFTGEPVDDGDLTAILEAGLSATSAMNAQPWFFCALTDQEIMAEIAGFGGAMPENGQPPENAPDGAMPEDGQPPENAPDGAMPEDGQPPENAPDGAMPMNAEKASLGSSPLAIIVYMDESGVAGTASFDCGLAVQNMFLAANALGYGAKIVSSPTMALNGQNHDALCEKLGVDKSLKAVAVLLIGCQDSASDAVTGATTRKKIDEKVVFVK